MKKRFTIGSSLSSLSILVNMSKIWAYLTVIASASPIGDDVPSLAIFNQWQYENPPVLFNWQDEKENSREMDSYSNPTKTQIKWSCSATLNDKMYIFGGEPDGGEVVTNVLEIKDCGIVDTGISLPWALVGHSCVVKEEAVYICGSLYGATKCTKFDGMKFEEVSSTKIGHTYGAMVNYKQNPIILGGGSSENKVDYDQVEQLEEDSWISIPSMLQPMKHFSAISYLNPANKFEVMITFGGYSSVSEPITKSYWYHGGYWFSGPGNIL